MLISDFISSHFFKTFYIYSHKKKKTIKGLSVLTIGQRHQVVKFETKLT